MEALDRHRLITQRLRVEGTASVVELAAELATSEVTVRRDLAELERLGALRRTRGGAENLLLRSEESPYGFRLMVAAAAKERIAAAAAERIQDGEAVVIDAGTTGLATARAVAGRALTVMPLGVQQVEVLASSSSTRLLMPGGSVRRGEGSVVGPIAERTLSAYRFDTFLLTCCGVSADSGVTAFDVEDASVKQIAAHRSGRVIALADGSKFSITAMAQVIDANELTMLITDESAPDRQLRRLEDQGVEVVRV